MVIDTVGVAMLAFSSDTTVPSAGGLQDCLAPTQMPFAESVKENNPVFGVKEVMSERA
ncbi:hypothetical protein [Marinobacter sp.]|uniref:hypothetical protein n=1 Tax=Marinobacter sp. TaxID=50741 RepID=UPI003A8FCD06